MKKFCILVGNPKSICEVWSDYTNTQADLNLRWTHMLERTVSHTLARRYVYKHWIIFSTAVIKRDMDHSTGKYIVVIRGLSTAETPMMFLFHYENTPIQIHWEFYHQKMKNFRCRILVVFIFSAQNIDCGYLLEPPRRGGSNEYPQSMYWSRNKKNKVYPYKPPVLYKMWGLRGSRLYKHVFLMYVICLKALHV